MKRTNLVLDEELLETATRLLGAKTYSDAVNRSLAQAIRLIKSRSMLELAGKGIWEGDLAEMRGDPRKKKSLRGKA